MKTVNSILLDNGINTDKQSEGARKVKCPKCQPPHNSKDFPLSLTITAHNVMWNCHHCSWSGGEFLTGMSKTYQTKTYEKPKKPERVVRNDFLYSFMKNRGLTKSTIDELKIYVDNGSWIAFPYFDENLPDTVMHNLLLDKENIWYTFDITNETRTFEIPIKTLGRQLTLKELFITTTMFINLKRLFL